MTFEVARPKNGRLESVVEVIYPYSDITPRSLFWVQTYGEHMLVSRLAYGIHNVCST